jgi:hypothetical protein
MGDGPLHLHFKVGKNFFANFAMNKKLLGFPITILDFFLNTIFYI